MSNVKTKILYISAFAILVAFFAIFYFSKSPTPEQILKPAPEQIAHQKCPEDYAEDDTGAAEYRDALINWTSEFFETHPDATMSDWSMAKSQLWADNNCVVAIQRSKMFGEIADLKPWERVDYAVQDAIQKAIDNSPQ